MKYSISLLLAAATAYALPADLAEISKREIDSGTLATLAFYEQYAAAAYCTSNNVATTSSQITCSAGNCPEVQADDAQSIYEFQNQGLADATGFVAVDNTRKEIVISYRGSRSVQNWLGNVDFTKVPFLCSGCEVHQGFLDSWTSTQSAITSAVQNALSANPGYSVVATGHSLGAAVATLCAAQLRSEGTPVTLYTYGSPEVGNPTFATSVSQSGPTYRVTHQKDLVPDLPGYVFGYAHTYPEYWITSDIGVTPTTNDITIVNQSKTQGLQGCENPLNFPGNILDHLWYFNSVATCL